MDDDQDNPDDDDLWVATPQRRDGTFLVYDFRHRTEHLPDILETIAVWARECAEYVVTQLSLHVNEEDTVVTVTVAELRPGDLLEQLARQGWNDLADDVAAVVTEHGVREGLRKLGFAYR